MSIETAILIIDIAKMPILWGVIGLLHAVSTRKSLPFLAGRVMFGVLATGYFAWVHFPTSEMFILEFEYTSWCMHWTGIKPILFEVEVIRGKCAIAFFDLFLRYRADPFPFMFTWAVYISLLTYLFLCIAGVEISRWVRAARQGA